MAVPKPSLTEFGIHYRLESCDPLSPDDVLRVTTLAFSSISKAQSKSSEQFTGKESKAEQKEKFCMGSFFAQFVV